jgi:hypothetical protein
MLGCGREIAQVRFFRRFSDHGYSRMDDEIADRKNLLSAICC